MFVIRNLTLVYADQVLFHDASCTIQAHNKIGVVGRNGAGKSTLLRILSGDVEPDEGDINIDSKKTVAYVPQETSLTSEKSVFDEAFAAFDDYLKLYHRAQELESQLTQGAADEDIVESYAQIQDKLNTYDYGALERQTLHVLHGLGFSEAGLSQPVNQLSVGWQMRVLLARQLLQRADFYLFDEPTNHLDLTTKAWFLQFLRNMNAGYMLISHSRYFLDHACDSIMEIERGNITEYKGNFTTYLTKKEELRQHKEQAKKEQEKEIARKRATIEKFKAKPTKAKMAKAMERQLHKMETIELEPPMPTVSFKFPPTPRSGKLALTVNNISHAFGDTKLFDNVNFELWRGQKAALIAPNGVGKTTLFNLIAGKLSLQQGSVTLGYNVSTAYFEQDQVRSLNHDNTIWQEVRNITQHISEAQIRTFLGAFLFSGDTIHRSIDALSGGEKNRVAMVKTLLQQANLLLLDEPTNHLDIYAKDVLLQAIQQYDGTVLYVSHDREFIEKTADKILELTPHGIITFDGDYTSYLEHRNRLQQSQTEEKASKTPDTTTTQNRDNTPREKQQTYTKQQQRYAQKRIKTVERYIEKLEEQRDQLAQELAHHTDTDTYNTTLSQLTQTQHELEQYESEWEQLSNVVEST